MDGTINGLGTPTVDLVSESHGVALKFTGLIGNYDTGFLNISAPYSGYLGFSFYGKSNNVNFLTTDCGLKLYSASDSLIEDTGIIFPLALYGNDSSQFHRADFIVDGGSLNFYVDGILKGSHAVSSLAGVTKIRLEIKGNSQSYTTDYLYLDDFSSSTSIVSCDSSAGSGEGEYYRTGHRNYSSSDYWFTRTFSPSGTKVFEECVAGSMNGGAAVISYAEHLIPASVLTSSGTYTIRLYRHNVADGSNMSYTYRAFSVNNTGTGVAGSIELNKSDYVPGDMMTVYSHLDIFESGCFVYTKIGSDIFRYNVTDEDQYGSIQIPATAVQAGNNLIYLVDSSGTVVAYANYNIYATTGGPSISLDKTVYERNNTVFISYKNVPTASTVTFLLKSGGQTISEITWDAIGVSSSIVVDLSDYPAGDGLLVILKDYSGNVVDQDSAQILAGQFYLTGRVFDSTTGAAVEGADVIVGGNTSTTGENGDYGLAALAGKNTFTINADGYFQLSGLVPVFDLISHQNFYITPILDEEGSGIYGTVTSSITGLPIERALVTAVTGSNSSSTLTDKRGYYNINQDGLNGSCNVKVSKENYDTFSKTIPVSGMTYVQFKLVASSGYEEADPSNSTGASDSDDSGSSESTADRPDRAAAKDSLNWLESVMPDLVKLAVMVFVLALIGWRF